jgi:hypothetical protein
MTHASKNFVGLYDIDAYFVPNSRAKNDESNRKRERALKIIHNESHPFFTEKIYGHKWCKIRNQFIIWLTNLHQKNISKWNLQHKGNLNHHYDFILYWENLNKEVFSDEIELKSGGVPQNLTEFDKTRWCNTLLAEFWYDNGWLDKIIEIYPKPLTYTKPSRAEYLAGVNQFLTDTSPMSFFKEIRNFDKNKIPRQISGFKNLISYWKAKEAITAKGIEEFLKLHGQTFDVSKLHTRLQAQSSKHYCIWDPKKQIFKYHCVPQACCNVKSIIAVNHNTVIIKAEQGLVNCRLRWKNTNGICAPAWQISMHPQRPTPIQNS